MVTKDTGKATLLNNFFVYQTVLDCMSNRLPDDCVKNKDLKINQAIFNAEEVYNVLWNLDTTEVTGPDGIGNKLLKEATLPISKPLSELDFCISLGVFPDVWKVAQVTPVFKKGTPYYVQTIGQYPCYH